MENYITPNFLFRGSYNDMKNYNLDDSLIFDFDEMEEMLPQSIDTILGNCKRLCILGDPGCGKTSFLDQQMSRLKQEGNQVVKYMLKNNDFGKIQNEIKDLQKNEYILFDALDEVEACRFSSALTFISNLSLDNPNIHIWFTCRDYYIKGNEGLFKMLSDFKYLKILLFKNEQIAQYIQVQINNKDIQNSVLSQLNTTSYKQLRNIIRVPRYLEAFCEYHNENPIVDISTVKRGDLFEYIIYKGIQAEKKLGETEYEIEIIKRMLEKIALIMEIHRVNTITIDDLFTIFDEVQTNLSTVFCSVIDIRVFIDRLLSREGELLQFNNTEFQEYLAAKELLRTTVPEQFFYDVAVDELFSHIYDNWFDVLSYVIERNSSFFIHLLTLISQKNSRMADERILKLIEVINISSLNENEIERIFSTYFNYYQQHDLFVSHASYLPILASLYTNRSYSYIKELVSKDNNENIRHYTRIVNQLSIIIAIDKQGILPDILHSSWMQILKEIIEKNDNHSLTKNALNILGDLKEKLILSDLCKRLYPNATPDMQIGFITAFAFAEMGDPYVIKLIIEGVEKGYPEAISACLYYQSNDIIIEIYSKITEKKELISAFFNAKNHIIIYETLHNQLEQCMANHYPDVKKIALSFLTYFSKELYLEHHQDTVCKGLLTLFKFYTIDLTEILLPLFLDGYELLNHLNWFYVFINQNNIEKIKQYAKENNFKPDGQQICMQILMYLKNQIEYNELYELYRPTYSDSYTQWESPIEKQEVYKANKWLEDLKMADVNNIKNCRLICNQIPEIIYLEKEPKLKDKLIQCLRQLIKSINLDSINVIRTSSTTHQISDWGLMKLNNYIKALVELGQKALVKEEFRQKCIHFLPIISNMGGIDIKDTELYQDIIGDMLEKEKQELVTWLKNRKDDYLTLNIKSLFFAIKRYKLIQLAPVVERYMDSPQDVYYASIALGIMAEDFMGKNIDYFRLLFSKQEPGKIEAGDFEEEVNCYLISKYIDREAGEWRIEYLKKHVFTTNRMKNKNSHARAISSAEAELLTPSFCNCFYERPSEKYEDLFIGLIEFSLNLCNKEENFDYVNYLLGMSLTYFQAIRSVSAVKNVGKLIREHRSEHAHRIAIPLLIKAELYLMNQPQAQGISYSIDTYNNYRRNKYALVRTEYELFKLVSTAIENIISIIENDGLYSIIDYAKENKLSEDFIQRTLKITLIDELLKLGIRRIDIDREVTLLDNKRPDLIIRHGFIGPILLELKLLHNPEITNNSKMKEYKKKLVQYIKAMQSKHSYYLVFKTKESTSKEKEAFEQMQKDYSDIDFLNVCLIDCKCSYIPTSNTANSSINKPKRGSKSNK